MSNKKRGTGRTAKQMMEAPINGVFVWHHHDVTYPRKIAGIVGRTDLKIVGPNWLLNNWQGVNLCGLVIDHYALESANEQMTDLIQKALLTVKEKA